MPLATLFVHLESAQWVMVHLVGFIMFQPIVEKLLNVEKVFCEILFQSKLKITKEFGCTLALLESP